jgi:LAO/AO transport system kinase
MPAGRDPAALAEAARGGDQGALARLLSMVERGGDAAQKVAAVTYPATEDAYTLGITGAPGAGKSTLTDRLLSLAKEEADGDKYAVGVLAVDPSSPFSGGAILGDRVRMPGHALDPRVYIRSMATRGHLGGLAVAVPDAVRLLSAVGIPLVIVETVGVGQQEVEVAGATDTTVVVLNPGWGDAIQASKAGLLEIGDLFAINKADRPGARETRRDLELMLDLTDVGEWRPPIVETVASTGEGVDALWEAIGAHHAHLREAGVLEARRADRLTREFQEILAARLHERLEELSESSVMADALTSVLGGEIDPYEAADRVVSRLLPAPGQSGLGGDRGDE